MGTLTAGLQGSVDTLLTMSTDLRLNDTMRQRAHQVAAYVGIAIKNRKIGDLPEDTEFRMNDAIAAWRWLDKPTTIKKEIDPVFQIDIRMYILVVLNILVSKRCLGIDPTVSIFSGGDEYRSIRT